jgi:hypothetical protein
MSPKQMKNQKLKQAALRAAEKKLANKIVANARRPKARRGRALTGPGGNFAGGRGALGLSGGGSRATSRRTQVIEEDEYIAEVSGTVGFGTTAYPLNPGQSSTFPWAYKIAALYEKYDFEQLEFYYKREVSEYASNGQTGKVILSFDYDASDAAPTSKQQVEDTVPHVDGMPCTPTIRLPIDCACIRNGPARYVRPGVQPTNTDIKTYDAGNLYVSTYGCAATSVVGELRVRYRCKFSEPVLESAGSAPGAVGAVAIFSSSAAEASGATTVATQLLLAKTDANAITAVNTAGSIVLPAGAYEVAASNIMTNTSPSDFPETFLAITVGGSNASTAAGAANGPATSPASVTVGPMKVASASPITLTLSVINTFSAGTTTNLGYVRITYLGLSTAIALSVASPSLSNNDLLLARLSRLEKLLEKDSEFEEEDVPSASSVKAAPSSSAASTSLSRSTLDVIGEIIARKSTRQ